jgi:hypothetical protein
MVESRLLKLENRLLKIEEHFSGDYQLVASKKMPHKCPVCEGHITILTEAAKVAFDELLRANIPTTKICVACNGTGIVWG